MATTETEVRNSVAALYGELLDRRRQEREERARQKEEKAEAKRLAAEQEGEGETKKLTKKEKQERAMNNWSEIIVGLTGEDLEYTSDKKKRKKKYRKWIGSDDELGTAMAPKQKKPKKKNFNKEFATELSMLKSIVADQNRFTNDLQKRFQNAAGPATKDAMPLNKTLVELAATVNASRSNALGYLNAISSIKKTIADLYMKQKKLESDLGSGTSVGDTDLALLGSSMMNQMFTGASAPMTAAASMGDVPTYAPPIPMGNPMPVTAPASETPDITQAPTDGIVISDFDPSSWSDDRIQVDAATRNESIPHTIVVEMDKTTGKREFKAVRTDTGEYLPDCPVPSVDPDRLKINEDTMTAKDDFAQIYQVRMVQRR